MTRQRLLSVALVAFGVVAAAVVTVVVVRGVASIRRDRLLEYTMRRVDSRLADREWESAARLLDDFASVKLGGDQWREVLRRAWVVAGNRDGWSGFGRLASRAAAQHPRNGDLVFLDISAAYRADEPASPSAVPPGARYDALRALLFLEGGAAGDAQPGAPEETPRDAPDPRELSISNDRVERVLNAALLQSADSLAAAHEATGDPRLAVDAALVRLREGEAAAAHEEISLRREGVSPVFRAKVALSAADFTGAVEALSQGNSGAGSLSAPDSARPDAPAEAHLGEGEGRAPDNATLLKGDALIGLGDFGRAERVYREVPRREWSPEAFQSVAFLIRSRGGEPEETLRAGVSRWSGDPESARALAVHIVDERPEEARALLDSFAEQSPKMRVTSLLLFDELKMSQRVRGTLWRMYNEADQAASGGSQAVGEYLAWYLAGLGDWDDLERVVSDPASDAVDWVRFYQGVLAVRSGRSQEARDAFAEIDAQGMRIAARYNEGRVALGMGDLDGAQAALEEAQDALLRRPRDGDRDRDLSRVLLELGRVHLLKGREETGYGMISRALRYNPGNATARNLLEEGSVSGTPMREGTMDDTTKESQAD
ncbi:MAG: hypothetical protein ACLFO1_01385 [Spirochaetaceae bacterium]